MPNNWRYQNCERCTVPLRGHEHDLCVRCLNVAIEEAVFKTITDNENMEVEVYDNE